MKLLILNILFGGWVLTNLAIVKWPNKWIGIVQGLFQFGWFAWFMYMFNLMVNTYAINFEFISDKLSEHEDLINILIEVVKHLAKGTST